MITTTGCSDQVPESNTSIGNTVSAPSLKQSTNSESSVSSLKQISSSASSNNEDQSRAFVTFGMATLKTGYAITKDFHVVKTTNGGRSWSQLISISKTSDYAPPELFVLNDKTVYIAFYTTTGIGVEKSIDGGSNWTKSNIKMKAKTIDPDEEGVLLFSFLNNSDGYLFSASSPGVGNYHLWGFYKTTDGGNSWSLANDFGSLQDNVHIGIQGYQNSMTFINENTGFITCSMTVQGYIPLYKTKDQGKFWAPVSLPIPKKYSSMKLAQDYLVQPGIISFFDKDSENAKIELVFQADNKDISYIYSSDDGGTTWKIDGISNKVISSYCFIDDKSGFGLDETGTLFVTKDGGITWSDVS
jgi:photosystem II stability/assembly factor-like uncharacterized protein